MLVKSKTYLNNRKAQGQKCKLSDLECGDVFTWGRRKNYYMVVYISFHDDRQAYVLEHDGSVGWWVDRDCEYIHSFPDVLEVATNLLKSFKDIGHGEV